MVKLIDVLNITEKTTSLLVINPKSAPPNSIDRRLAKVYWEREHSAEINSIKEGFINYGILTKKTPIDRAVNNSIIVKNDNQVSEVVFYTTPIKDFMIYLLRTPCSSSIEIEQKSKIIEKLINKQNQEIHSFYFNVELYSKMQH